MSPCGTHCSACTKSVLRRLLSIRFYRYRMMDLFLEWAVSKRPRPTPAIRATSSRVLTDRSSAASSTAGPDCYRCCTTSAIRQLNIWRSQRAGLPDRFTLTLAEGTSTFWLRNQSPYPRSGAYQLDAMDTITIRLQWQANGCAAAYRVAHHALRLWCRRAKCFYRGHSIPRC